VSSSDRGSACGYSSSQNDGELFAVVAFKALSVLPNVCFVLKGSG